MIDFIEHIINTTTTTTRIAWISWGFFVFSSLEVPFFIVALRVLNSPLDYVSDHRRLYPIALRMNDLYRAKF